MHEPFLESKEYDPEVQEDEPGYLKQKVASEDVRMAEPLDNSKQSSLKETLAMLLEGDPEEGGAVAACWWALVSALGILFTGFGFLSGTSLACFWMSWSDNHHW